jgi:hypothetical protein
MSSFSAEEDVPFLAVENRIANGVIETLAVDLE